MSASPTVAVEEERPVALAIGTARRDGGVLAGLLLEQEMVQLLPEGPVVGRGIRDLVLGLYLVANTVLWRHREKAPDRVVARLVLVRWLLGCRVRHTSDGTPKAPERTPWAERKCGRLRNKRDPLNSDGLHYCYSKLYHT